MHILSVFGVREGGGKGCYTVPGPTGILTWQWTEHNYFWQGYIFFFNFLSFIFFHNFSYYVLFSNKYKWEGGRWRPWMGVPFLFDISFYVWPIECRSSFRYVNVRDIVCVPAKYLRTWGIYNVNNIHTSQWQSDKNWFLFGRVWNKGRELSRKRHVRSPMFNSTLTLVEVSASLFNSRAGPLSKWHLWYIRNG